MDPIYIVGSGLFGRIAHDMLAANGQPSTIVDTGASYSGSMASGNITKPSWITGLGKEAQVAYDDLNSLYGLNKISPKVLGKSIDLFYVSRSKTIKPPDIVDHVEHVGDGWLKFVDGRMLYGKILVAAGIWTERLVSMPPIDCIMGVSLLFDGEHEPKFSAWAPYKQSISYGFEGQTWFGDGTAIKYKNFDFSERTKATIKRAAEHGLTNPVVTNIGSRPYVKGYKNGYFQQVHKNTWVSTGGGKNGITLAALQARKFMEAL